MAQRQIVLSIFFHFFIIFDDIMATSRHEESKMVKAGMTAPASRANQTSHTGEQNYFDKLKAKSVSKQSCHTGNGNANRSFLGSSR